MTSAVAPGYIRWVSVQSPRCPSAKQTTRSTLDTTNYVIQRSRPKTANDITSAARHQAGRILKRERTAMLDELMFLYGRGVHESFNFSRSRPTTATNRNRHINYLSLSAAGSPWQHDNNACLQMYRASTQLPRHRIFPSLYPSPIILQRQIENGHHHAPYEKATTTSTTSLTNVTIHSNHHHKYTDNSIT